jgi:hypothetical protein
MSKETVRVIVEALQNQISVVFATGMERLVLDVPIPMLATFNVPQPLTTLSPVSTHILCFLQVLTIVVLIVSNEIVTEFVKGTLKRIYVGFAAEMAPVVMEYAKTMMPVEFVVVTIRNVIVIHQETVKFVKLDSIVNEYVMALKDLINVVFAVETQVHVLVALKLESIMVSR